MDLVIVEHSLPNVYAIHGCYTNGDLREYLNINPHPKYRLVNANLNNGKLLIIWELICT